MKFLLPIGGIVDTRFGILTSPRHKGVPSGIIAGMPWAGDNDAFKNGFNPDTFFPWLRKMELYKDNCLFIAAPDCVGNSTKTIDLYNHWYQQMVGWPLAFVAQDGQENLLIPDSCSTVFIGGTTHWKISHNTEQVINRALDMGKKIHIGRVNWKKRYNHFAGMKGSKEWTCDGTRTRYEGVDKTIIAWAEYMAAPKQLRFYLSSGNNIG